MIKIFLSLLFFCLLSINANADSFKEIKGQAHSLNGRTLKINGQKVQLYGIDAPDFEQMCQSKNQRKPFQCGLISNFKLFKLTKHLDLVCKGKGHSNDGTLLATCYVGKIDIAQQMLLLGWAIADENVSVKKYKIIEKDMQAREVGLWDGHFIKPWEWRKGKRLPPSKYKAIKVIKINEKQ